MVVGYILCTLVALVEFGLFRILFHIVPVEGVSYDKSIWFAFVAGSGFNAFNNFIDSDLAFWFVGITWFIFIYFNIEMYTDYCYSRRWLELLERELKDTLSPEEQVKRVIGITDQCHTKIELATSLYSPVFFK